MSNRRRPSVKGSSFRQESEVGKKSGRSSSWMSRAEEISV